MQAISHFFDPDVRLLGVRWTLFPVMVCLASLLGLTACSQSPPPQVAAAYAHSPDRVRRLTQEQYANTIHYIFGGDIDIGTPFAPLRRTDGLLASGAATAGVTAGELQQLQRSASSIAAQVLDSGSIEHKTPSRREFLVPCKPADVTAADDDCARKFLKQAGRLLYRQRLSDANLAEKVALAHQAAKDLKDFYSGLGLVLEGMLLDPKFLMIVDATELDPDHPGKLRLDAYSLAARLSFFLWNAGPDDALLRDAESGELRSKSGLVRAVDRMLASPRLEVGVRAFFDDMLGFDDLETLAKDPSVYPAFTGTTVSDAREQTLRTVVDQLITRNADYRDLYTTRSTFISPALAALYDIPAPPGWTPYEFPTDSPRTGMLTQISFLAVHAHPARSSPTRRGKALRELLLCQNVPTPPPNVDFSALNNPDVHYRTQRERVAFHLQNATCAGCHKITDPMGLALESFDGAGRFRETENGAKIDTSGSLDGKKFDNVVGLASALHDNAALTSCFVQRLYSYGSGGTTTKEDRPILNYLKERFAKDGYHVPDLMRTIALGFAYPRVGKAGLSAARLIQAANTPLPLVPDPKSPGQK